MSRTSCLSILSAILLAFVLSGLAVASHTPQRCRKQHRAGAAHQRWSVPAGDNTSIEETIVLSRDSPNGMFYTLELGFVGGGGYIGIQPGPEQHHVRFSIWNAQQAEEAEGADCTGFAHEGVGLTCTLDFQFESQAEYTVRMIPIDLDDPAGPWWQGSLIDYTGEEHVIGRIQGPAGLGLIRSAVSWIEYFGLDADDTCQCLTLPPVAEALFRRPLINDSTYADYANATRGGCSGGRVTPIPDYLCSRIELGVDKTSTRDAFGRPVYGPAQCVACRWDSDCPSGERCGCDHACFKPD